MIKDWNSRNICSEISKISWAASDPRMDGYITWNCKQELYQILWHVQRELDKCGSYGDIEHDYVKKHDQEMLLRALGKK